MLAAHIYITSVCTLLGACLSLPYSRQSAKHVSFAAVGDVMCHTPQIRSAYKANCQCYLFHTVFRPIRPYVSQVDVAIANFETTLPGHPSKYKGYPLFGAPDSLMRALRYAGIDILSLANNHSLDNGAHGLRRTIQVARRLHLHHLGTYASYTARENTPILILHKKGLRLAFINYTYGTNGLPVPPGMKVNILDQKAIAADLRLAYEARADFTIVLYHFGKEYASKMSRMQKHYVRHAFYHGADVVLGTHPHVVQPYYAQIIQDKYGRRRRRLVAYSLGNFVSNQRKPLVDGGMILYFDLVKKHIQSVKKETQFFLRNVRHELIWVYVEKKGAAKNYYVLPIAKYKANNASPRLKGEDYKKMMRFYDEASSVLAASSLE